MLTDIGVKAILAATIAATPMSDQLMRLAYQFDSDLPSGKSEDLSFLGAIGVIKEWGAGGRNVGQPKEYEFSLRNAKFSGGVQIPNDWRNNDKTRQVQDRLNGLARRLQQFWSSKVATLVNSAETSTKTLDGVTFFSNSHAKYSSFDNLLTHAAASGTAPTALEVADALYESYIALLSYLDDQGQPANEGMSEMLVTCGTDIGAAVMAALSQDTLNTGTGTLDNPLKGLRAAGVKLSGIVSPRITTTAKMQVWNVSPGSKNLLIQRNKADSKTDMLGVGSDFEKLNDAIQMLVKEVGEAGYGRPWEATQCEFT